MSERVVSPQAAAEQLVRVVGREWAELVCDELARVGPRVIEVQLAPGVHSAPGVARVGFDVVHAWEEAWRDVAVESVVDATIRTRHVPVRGVARHLPATLEVRSLEGALAFITQAGVGGPAAQVEHGRRVADALVRSGASIDPATLRAACRLGDSDLDALVGAVRWLRHHADASAWTARQLPVPGIHSKWLERHGGLLRDLTGRDVLREVRPRLAVVHLTYVDPSYVAAGGRRHDAWTTGDAHELAYEPSTVVVVENRDCRLWFPLVDGAIVVEGGGKAAASLLADVPWVRRCRTLVYWGDIDADGFAILDRFRAVVASPAGNGLPAQSVHSILMDAQALDRYEHLGSDRDRNGQPIPPSSVALRHLTAQETTAYYSIATRGSVAVRRIEQERIPIGDAATALHEVLRL